MMALVSHCTKKESTEKWHRFIITWDPLPKTESPQLILMKAVKGQWETK